MTKPLPPCPICGRPTFTDVSRDGVDIRLCIGVVMDDLPCTWTNHKERTREIAAIENLTQTDSERRAFLEELRKYVSEDDIPDDLKEGE